MASSRRRIRQHPRRGEPGSNVLVAGDTGTYGGPQGGARPLKEAWHESGDLESREYGVPEADLPGGKTHVVNPETHPHRPPGVPERPADYHKHHGVASDDGLYEVPDGTVGPRQHTSAPAAEIDAVPVYVVEGGGKEHRIRALVTDGPMSIPASTAAQPADPIRLADRDPRRVKFWICNEADVGTHTTSNAVRIGEWETIAEGRGLLIPGATLKDFNTQDSVFVINESGAAVTISWGYETEIPVADPNPGERGV